VGSVRGQRVCPVEDGEGTMEPRIDRTQFGSVTIDGASSPTT